MSTYYKGTTITTNTCQQRVRPDASRKHLTFFSFFTFKLSAVDPSVTGARSAVEASVAAAMSTVEACVTGATVGAGHMQLLLAMHMLVCVCRAYVCAGKGKWGN
jgi:hypothetical protein